MASSDPPALESPSFEPARYTITVGEDGSLQWDPPPGSKELGFALSYHFPKEPTMVDKMQAALRKWFMHQLREPTMTKKNSISLIHGRGSTRVKILGELGLSCSEKAYHIHQDTENKRGAAIQGCGNSPPRKRSKIPGQITWRLGAETKRMTKSKKRSYSKEERDEVGKNRGKACDYHRRRKEKCHPADCPQNKLHVYQESLPASGTLDSYLQDKSSEDALDSLNRDYSLALPSTCTMQDPKTTVYPLVPEKNSLGGQPMFLQPEIQTIKSSALRLDINQQDIEISTLVHNTSSQAKAKDIANSHSQATSHSRSSSYDTVISNIREEPIQESRNPILFELGLTTGAIPEIPLLYDQTVTSDVDDIMGVRQSQKGIQTRLLLNSSDNANDNCDTAIETVPPFSGALETEIGLELNQTEDSYPFLWPLSPHSYQPTCEHISKRNQHSCSGWTEPCRCSCECCTPMPLPPDNISGDWSHMFDEPFTRPRPRPLSFDSFSKLVLESMEDIAVRDIPDGGVAVRCAIAELFLPLRDPLHESRKGRYLYVRPILETHLGVDQLSVPSTEDEFVSLLTWAFDKWTFWLDCEKAENCLLASCY